MASRPTLYRKWDPAAGPQLCKIYCCKCMTGFRNPSTREGVAREMKDLWANLFYHQRGLSCTNTSYKDDIVLNK